MLKTVAKTGRLVIVHEAARNCGVGAEIDVVHIFQLPVYALPDGAMITATTPRIELDQVLSAFDPETRAELRRIIPGIDQALAGNEEDLGATLQAAGPSEPTTSSRTTSPR